LEQAGERARAANCYGTFLRVAPADEPRRSEAERRRDALAPALGVLELVATSATDLTVDTEPVEAGDVYLDPGDHVVAGRGEERAISPHVTRVAGGRLRLDLGAPAEPPVEKPAPTAAPPVPPPSTGGSGLHPAWFLVGVAASAGLGGLTIRCGLATHAAPRRHEDPVGGRNRPPAP